MHSQTFIVCSAFAIQLAGLLSLNAARAADPPARSAATAPAGDEAGKLIPEGSTPPQPPALPREENPLTLIGDWFGARKKLADQGIAFDLTLTLDGSKNLRGGLDTGGSAFRNLFEATLTIDTKPLFKLDGGKVFADFQNASGRNATDHLVGDAQRFSNIDADGRTQLAQLWYQQTFLGEKLRLKIGKVDANSEFEKSDNAGESIHSSSAFSPTIFVLPTYPDGATSINLFVQPGAGFYGGFGVYDGSIARGIPTGSLGPKTFFRDPRDLFLIAEVGRRRGTDPNQLPGRLAVGGWYDTNRSPRLAGGQDSAAGGAYFVFDQTLYRPPDRVPDGKDDNRGIGLFLLGGEADPHVSLFHWHLGGGIAWTGPLPDRQRDVLGFSLNAVGFSPDARLRSDHEVAVEAFYRFQVTPWASVKPDLQYIATPGGNRRDAVVATVRFLFNF